MRKLFLVLMAALLLGGMTVQAAPVSADRALEVAKKALAKPATKASGDLKLIWNGEDAATKAATQPAFYVFGRDGGGFVIVAGDDNVQPVLAISETNEFKVEGMPENVKWWMERMKVYVRNAAPAAAVKEQWTQFSQTKSGPVVDNLADLTDRVEKLTPEWDQGNNDGYLYGEGKHIYNLYCPADGSNLTLTGCVATALGEILTYQSGIYGASMPVSGTGSVGGYTASSGCVTPASYDLETVYDWANLRTLTGWDAIKAVVDANTAEGNALLGNLGHLLADLGAMVEAQYAVDGTSAASPMAITGLGTHMGYNKAAYYAAAADYTPGQWVQMLKAELDKRPILYDGRTVNNAGHAFVFDGYGTFFGNDVFHVNFGWSGSCNGYYYYYSLDATDSNNYSYNCGAIFDFYPAPESSFTYSLEYNQYYLPGIQFHEGYVFDAANPFVIDFCFTNVGYTQYNGYIAAKLVDRNGDIKAPFEMYDYDKQQFVDYISLTGLASNGILSMSNHIRLKEGSPAVAFGDKIVLYCTTDEAKTVFEPFKGHKDGTTLNSLPVMPAAFIKTEASYNVGDYFQFELMNNGYMYSGTVWTITLEGGSAVVKNQSELRYQLTDPGTYKIEATVKEATSMQVKETITAYITVN